MNAIEQKRAAKKAQEAENAKLFRIEMRMGYREQPQAPQTAPAQGQAKIEQK